MHLKVEADSKGEAVLSGNVKTQAEVDKAVSIARGAEGVTSVVTKIMSWSGCAGDRTHRGGSMPLIEACYCKVKRLIRLPMISTSTRRSGCKQPITAVLLAPLQSAGLVAGCDSPLPSVTTRLASIPLLTR